MSFIGIPSLCQFDTQMLRALPIFRHAPARCVGISKSGTAPSRRDRPLG